MKNKLNTTFSILILAILAFGQTVFGQQGGLDTTWGINNTGIYQDAFPTLPLPNPNLGDEGRQFGASEILADGKIIAAGHVGIHTGGGNYVFDFLVRRLNADGSVDPTFGTNGEARTTFYRWGPGLNQRSVNSLYAMKVQPADGKIILASSCGVGDTVVPGGTPLGTDLCLVRYNANGTLDTSFGGNTVFSYYGNPNFPGNNNTVDPGKVFTLTGTNTVNGATVGFGGIPVKIQIAPDGRIFVFGYNSSDTTPALNGSRNKSFVAVYSTNGTLQNIVSLVDTTGNPTNGYGTTRIYDGDLLSNGDFIAVGYQVTLVSSNPQVFSPARWKTFTGSSGGGFLESSANVFGEARSITMLRSNKILVGGNLNSGGTPTLIRYNGDLTVDTTFGTNGRIVYDGTGNNNDTGIISSLKTQPDGKIIGTTNNGDIVRFNANGSLDRSFARLREDVADSLSLRGILPSRRYLTPFPVVGTDRGISYGGISIRPNGKIVAAGFAGSAFGSFPYRATVVQLKTSLRNGGTFSDFNNDGKAEIAVFRGGFWYQLDSFSGNFSGAQFGASTDKLAPADYDGDGKTDYAVFRPSSGTWYILQSSNNQFRGVQFGAAEDLPRPGDFNGDGQADIAVFRPSNGTWYILYSNPIQPGNITFAAVQFGQAGDVPLLADFDGDGKSDVAVYRGGFWYYLRSTDGQFRAVQFGAASDIPVVGDYDADAQADI
ncbi:MAG: FG-GAP-like repeat-containing protein, partial [Pyrinomonadaceae bacterium]|nr:FG-GAP-like repeat-containing protein [Pyrinomonadaceae bacterium]